jgi:hypothetical protein
MIKVIERKMGENFYKQARFYFGERGDVANLCGFPCLLYLAWAGK